jgi:hypothetical protein
LFISADRLMAQRQMHAISYGWNNFRPELLVYSDNQVNELELNEMHFLIGEERRCTGSFREQVYRPCPFNRVVEFSDQCEFCSRSLIPIRRCLFDPICDGHICGWELCSREHIVYIAFYGTFLKVGMTSAQRVRERLIEQGADAYFEVAHLPNRLKARELEKRLSSELLLPQVRHMNELIALFNRKLDVKEIESIYEELLCELKEKYNMEAGELQTLLDYPIELPLNERAVPVEVEGVHEGKIIGFKGRFALYKSNDIRVLNMPMVIGRSLTLLSL